MQRFFEILLCLCFNALIFGTIVLRNDITFQVEGHNISTILEVNYSHILGGWKNHVQIPSVPYEFSENKIEEFVCQQLHAIGYSSEVVFGNRISTTVKDVIWSSAVVSILEGDAKNSTSGGNYVEFGDWKLFNLRDNELANINNKIKQSEYVEVWKRRSSWPRCERRIYVYVHFRVFSSRSFNTA